jgi:hypothetical protein
MFCIVAFIIFAILGIFSASYRGLAKKAWVCVSKRITLKPCDIDLQAEIRARLLGKLIFSHPKIAQYIDRWMNTFAAIFVALSIWSLLVVANGALNFYVYGTCTPGDPEACSLSSGGCGVATYKPGFWLSLKTGTLGAWTIDSANTYKETFRRIPDRMKTWEAKDFIRPFNTFKGGYQESKPVALEIIDPSCTYCAQLYANILEAEFEKRYNVSYILYPIPDNTASSGYKFPHSLLLAQYLEALKDTSIHTVQEADWRLMHILFTKQTDQVFEQENIRTVYTREEMRTRIHEWLTEIGLNEKEKIRVEEKSRSQEISDTIAAQKELVEKDIRTIKIPTIIFDGRRYDKAVAVNTLKE